MPKLVRSTLLGKRGSNFRRGTTSPSENYFMDLMTPERMTDYHDLLNETFLMNWINNPVPLSFFTHKKCSIQNDL